MAINKTVKINPTGSTIFTLARALDVSLSELFNFDLPVINKEV